MNLSEVSQQICKFGYWGVPVPFRINAYENPCGDVTV